ncbi:hypothetical protein Tco_0962419 [Tanacetum coccineum]
MDAPTILVSVDSSEGNFRDAIDIGLDVDHPVPIVVVAFPAVTIVTILASLGEAIQGIHKYLQGVPIEEMSTLRFRMGMAKVENASLHGKIRTMEAIETVTRSQERRTRREMSDSWLQFRSHIDRTEIILGSSRSYRKERIKPLRVRALVMTIGLDLPKQILNAQTEAQKPENLKHEDVGVVRFGKRGKLNPRYVGPFQVLAKVRAIALKLELPQELSKFHNTSHVSNLKKCYADKPLAVPLDGLHIDDKLHFVKEQVEIMD